MTEIIGVRFKRSGKVYYFRPEGLEVNDNQGVIVETARGIEYGYVSISNIVLPESLLPAEPKPIIRLADEQDEWRRSENERMSKDAYAICTDKIAQHHLEMKLVEAEYTFDRSKLIFYFISENRIDFRELVRDLAQTFKTRIELRQIGVRDQAKMIGAVGSCGQEICCHRYMDDFAPVSIKMAKTQGLSLNPTKISGVCGRLMCCLNYEQEHYLENTKQVPAKGTLVLTADGQGYVVDRDILQKRLRVHVYKADNTEDERYYEVSAVEVLAKRKKGHPKPELMDLAGHVFRPEGAEEAAGCLSCGGSCAEKGCGVEDPLETAEVVAEETFEPDVKRSRKRRRRPRGHGKPKPTQAD